MKGNPHFTLKLTLILFLFSACANSDGDHYTISADDVRISYTVDGSGEPALVFIHGWSCDGEYWRNQVNHFKNNCRVVTIDLAGHGESGLDRETYTMKAFGEDVAAVIKELDIESAVLIGHSMGGAVIIEAARLMPQKVIGLVGADTYQNIEISISDEQIVNYLKLFESNFEGQTFAFVKNMFTADADSLLVAGIADDMSSANPKVAISAMNEYFHYSYIESLRDLEIPITCINSDLWDTNISAGKRYAKSFDVKIMKGVGHFVMLERPDEFNKLLEESIAEFSR